MAIRVNKKVFVVGAIFLFLALTASAGFVAWRLSQEKEVTPEESEAGGNCPDGFHCDFSSCAHPEWENDTDGWCKRWGPSGESVDCCVRGEGGGGKDCASIGILGDGEEYDKKMCTDICNGMLEGSGYNCVENGGVACKFLLNGSLVEGCAYADPNNHNNCGTCQSAGDGKVYWDGNTLHNESGNNVTIYVHHQSNSSDNCNQGLNGYSDSVIVENRGTYTMSCCEQADPHGYAGRCDDSCCSRSEGPVCGDGVRNGDEQCDSNDMGNCPIGSKCTKECKCFVEEPACGNGKCDAGETCDPNGARPDIKCPGGVTLSTTCRADCSYCGDGTTDLGEECDPPGSTCASGNLCTSSCSCPPVIAPTYLTVRGEVYCQDPNGLKYPVEGANLVFSKISSSETLVTGPNGQYSSQVNVTTGEHKPFSVKYTGLADSSKELPTGLAYSEMEGPVVDSPAICTTGKCSTCASEYSGCYGLAEGANEGFNWVFTHCSPAEINPDWSIEKSNSVTCVDEGTVNAYADINYTITVKNIAKGGKMLSVTDNLDARVAPGSVTRIVPAEGVVSGTTILWNSGYAFAEGETKTFTYTIRVPAGLFGSSLGNHVVAILDTSGGLPEDKSQLHAYSSALVVCRGYGSPLPGTGLFDSTVARIVLGITCVLFGYAYYRFGLLDGMMNWVTVSVDKFAGKVKYTASSEGRRDRWERRLIIKVDKSMKRRRR